jgi:hypothetical protein
MKISELIEKLKTLDPNIEVFTKGYEGGYCDIEEDFELHLFKKDVNKEWFNGPHDIDENGTILGIVL